MEKFSHFCDAIWEFNHLVLELFYHIIQINSIIYPSLESFEQLSGLWAFLLRAFITYVPTIWAISELPSSIYLDFFSLPTSHACGIRCQSHFVFVYRSVWAMSSIWCARITSVWMAYGDWSSFLVTQTHHRIRTPWQLGLIITLCIMTDPPIVSADLLVHHRDKHRLSIANPHLVTSFSLPIPSSSSLQSPSFSSCKWCSMWRSISLRYPLSLRVDDSRLLGIIIIVLRSLYHQFFGIICHSHFVWAG